MTKIKELFGSIRFWLITVLAVVAMTKGYVELGSFDILGMLTVVQVWIGAVVGIGTLDSVATKFGLSIAGVKRKK